MKSSQRGEIVRGRGRARVQTLDALEPRVLLSGIVMNTPGITTSVDALDESIARDGYTYYLNEVHLLTPCSGAGAALAPVVPTGFVIMPRPIVPITSPPVITIFTPPISFIHPPIALPEVPLVIVPWAPLAGAGPKGAIPAATLPALLTALESSPAGTPQPMQFIRATFIRLVG